MKPIIISEQDYRDKVFACWLGKNIGGTLGAPYEGRREVLQLSYYDPLPSESAANDDLDLQLVWVKMLQERGIDPRLQDFADYWMKHLSPYPWNEYGFCQRNLQRGLRPPISGCFENHYIDEMGSPIRSEIWACIAPGDPELAAVMAWKDAVLDHAGGEGMWGEMFWAALESAAFVMGDPAELIRIGLGMIPSWSRIARVVKCAAWHYENKVPWEQARANIVRDFGSEHPCDATQNHGFTIMGWLYGQDYGDKLCKAVNCGRDTDCTGATLGSLLGILGGTKGIPNEWRDPVGDAIVLHKLTHELDAPKTISELAEQTVEIGRKVLAERSKIAGLGKKTSLPGDLVRVLSAGEEARALWNRDVESSTVPVSNELEITLHYHGEPVIRPTVPKTLGITAERNGEPVRASATLKAPAGWRVKRAGATGLEVRYQVTADEPSESNRLEVRADVDGKEYRVEFVILGPGAAKGWNPFQVASCPNCGARVEACLCGG